MKQNIITYSIDTSNQLVLFTKLGHSSPFLVVPIDVASWVILSIRELDYLIQWVPVDVPFSKPVVDKDGTDSE